LLALRAAFVAIRTAFLFRSIKGSLFNQHTLTLVTATRPAESNNHGGKSAVLPGTPCKSGITSGKINQVIQIGAPQAKRASPFHEEKISLAQFMETFCAFRLAQNVEDHQVLSFRWRLLFLRLHTFSGLPICEKGPFAAAAEQLCSAPVHRIKTGSGALTSLYTSHLINAPAAIWAVYKIRLSFAN
jgi:hypothetical protein